MTRGHYISGEYPANWPEIANRIKEQAGWCCERCGHPTEKPWKAAAHRYKFLADAGFLRGSNAVRWVCHRCEHVTRGNLLTGPVEMTSSPCIYGKPSPCLPSCTHPQNGKQRVLTVDHLDGDKSNCDDWNLAVLCQVCHLQIQGKVRMKQSYAFPHSAWMQPHVDGMLKARESA